MEDYILDRKRDNAIEIVFWKVKVENFPNLAKDIHLQFQEAG